MRPLIKSRLLQQQAISRSFSTSRTRFGPAVDHGASSKLFADAVVEERNPGASTPPPTRVAELAALRASQERIWDGDESTEDAVLRMLVDKYKPLRTGVMQTADQRLKAEAAKPNASRGLTIDDLPPLQLPKSFASDSKGKTRSRPHEADPGDAKARAESRRAKKLDAGPRRVGSALEKSLDYRIVKTWGTDAPGVSTSSNVESAIPRRPNPANMKGWAALVEDKIEQARSKGIFEKVEGRGKPLKQQTDEGNPFIGREEFLMNRIIRRQGAAPPWVEVQGELEDHIRTFRNVLRSNWVRRATRNIMLSVSPPPYARTLPNLTIDSITAMRDPDWERREESYHQAALDEVNSQIRRHNGIAPFAARRGYLMRKYELERCYQESAEEIMRTVQENLANETSGRTIGWMDESETGASGSAGSSSSSPSGRITGWRLWDALKRLTSSLMQVPTHLEDPGRSRASSSP